MQHLLVPVIPEALLYREGLLEVKGSGKFGLCGCWWCGVW